MTGARSYKYLSVQFAGSLEGLKINAKSEYMVRIILCTLIGFVKHVRTLFDVRYILLQWQKY
jgi:hypothetical protein